MSQVVMAKRVEPVQHLNRVSVEQVLPSSRLERVSERGVRQVQPDLRGRLHGVERIRTRVALSARNVMKRIRRRCGGPQSTNVFAIPLAAGVLAEQGILLPPAFAAVLMFASTVIVAINAQLLRRARL